MPLQTDKGQVITAHASKASKVDLKIFTAHTSVLCPLLVLPVFPFLTTLKLSVVAILILVLLERRGWTVMLALKRMRARLAGRHRFIKTRYSILSRVKPNNDR